MISFDVVQGIIIGFIVAACAVHVARKLFPRTVASLQTKAAKSLSHSSRPAAVRRVGTWLQSSTATGGCGSGCSSCSSCESNPQKDDVKPLEFRRHM